MISARPHISAASGLPSVPRYTARFVQPLRQILVLPGYAEKRIADAGESRLISEISDAVRLFAITTHQFHNQKIGHSRPMIRR